MKKMYPRTLKDKLSSKLGKGKAIVIVGPRQVGKTTLIKSIIGDSPHLFLDGDNLAVRSLLTDINTEELKTVIGKHNLVFIDEAQRINDIGLTAKIITDQFKHVQLILSGSSSFDISNKTNEPLTGRKWEYELFPISWKEYEDHNDYLVALQQLENRIIFGSYPDVINNPGEEIEILKNLVNSYLYKDLLALSDIRKPQVLDDLIQALALQIGSEANFNELSQTIGVDKNTVRKYIEIIEKGYIIFRLRSFNRNIRNEIKKNQKIYFWDTGIRNMIIENFNSLKLRLDKGVLWENFLIVERKKQIAYNNRLVRSYFWRTRQQQEVDYVEVEADKISGFEFKWSTKKNVKLPKTFIEGYHARSILINSSNYRDFVI